MGEEEEESMGPNGAGIRVSQFDHSVENHFKAVDKISKLCGEPEIDSSDESQFQCLSSSINFLREWKYYNYEPTIVRFASQMDNTQERSFLGEINLPQFSSSTVPKKKGLDEGTAVPESVKDFVMYVGGSVWALDWCPRAADRADSHIKCEYVAIAAHPPESNYHKLGTPLTGRGVIQIWCILHVNENEESAPPMKMAKRRMQCHDICGDKSTSIKRPSGRPKSTSIKRPRGRPRKQQIAESVNGEATKDNSTEFKRPRGRPKKLQMEDSPNGDATEERSSKLKSLIDEPTKQQVEESQNSEATEKNSTPVKRPRGTTGRKLTEISYNSVAMKESSARFKRPKQRPRKKVTTKSLDILDVQYLKDLSSTNAIEVVSGNTHEQTLALLACNPHPETTEQNRQPESEAMANDKCAGVVLPHLVSENKDMTFNMNCQTHETSEQDPAVLSCGLDVGPLNINSNSCSVPEDVALPRVVLCLAHNGKVAWDVKWRPCNASDSKGQHQMGYLAVLLGNGTLEVWDVPLPQAVKVVYSSAHGENTDPRFLKLDSVFRCSFAKCGEMMSIPLTVEWSNSYPHDYLLAGCHDGTVALWKFTVSRTPGDTRPLLCFSADTCAIRAVAWAPSESGHEHTNIVLTAGHGGLKFWDIRDPFRPLWENHTSLKFIYSLDWLPDPRCVILSLDDGTMILLSLSKIACDGHVNGKPSLESKQPGLQTIHRSSLAIWNFHVSRKTGMVAYCGADGTVCHFQLTSKAVEKSLSRNRAPHFMACSLSKDDKSAITVNTPLHDALTLKKPLKNAKDNQTLLDSERTKGANNKNTEKAPAADNQLTQLALCNGDDPGMQFGFDETLAAVKRRIKKKSKETSDKMDEEDKAIERAEEVQDGLEKHKATNKIEVLPPDIIAMYRVRWNMNKGSERWLCSGGAAGIVRCQEIR